MVDGAPVEGLKGNAVRQHTIRRRRKLPASKCEMPILQLNPQL